MAEACPGTILGNTSPSDGALRSHLHFAPHHRSAKHLVQRPRRRQRKIYRVSSTTPRESHRTNGTRSIVVIILFIGLCLLFDFLSMIWLCRHSLRPKTFLIFQVIETTIWVVLVVLSIVGLAQIRGSGYRRPSPLAYILQIILL